MENEFNFFDLLLAAILEQLITFIAGWFRSLLEGLF